MKIVDRYLVRQFVQTIIFGLLAFTILFVVIDMMENLDDFIDKDVPNSIIFEYYLVFMPEIIRLMIPVAVLLASLFVVGKMSNLNEITAIRSAGVSLFRFMLPFFITAVFISAGSVYFGGYVVPMANKHKVDIEQNYMKRGIENTGNNLFFQDSETRIVRIAYYNISLNEANRISIQNFSQEDITQMESRIDARRMKYDSLSGNWIMQEATMRKFDRLDETVTVHDTLVLGYLNFEPEDVIKKQRKPVEMTLTELREYADERLQTGNDPTRVEIEYHSRIAFSFASLVVVLFGLPLSADKRRGGLALQFGVNLLITFIYLVFMNISQAFGKNGVLNPFLTAWFANIIFLAAAGINLIRVPK